MKNEIIYFILKWIMVILCENKIYSNNSDNVMEIICKESYEDVSLYVYHSMT